MSITVKNLHSQLPEDQLHEAKGFSTASNNTYLKKNHEGSSEWLSEYWLEPVLGVVTGSSAPPTESTGDRYILTSSSFDSGWDSPSQYDIVEFNGTSWISQSAVDGMRVVDLSNDSVYYFNTAWNQVTDAGITGIGDTLTSATQGSVLFAGASGVLAQDNTNLFWDDSNNRLGIGTNSPAFDLHVLNSGDLDTKVESNGGHSRFIIDSQDTDDSILQFNENNARRWSIYTDGTDDKLKITRSDVPTASPTSDAISIDTSDNVSIPNGTLTINDYTFPSADGSASQVLQTDGLGNLTFATAASGGASDLNGLDDVSILGSGVNWSFFKNGATPTGAPITGTFSGTRNVALGYSSLGSITSGASNIAIGYFSGVSITTGSDNVLIGRQAGSVLNSDMTNTTAIGAGALDSSTTGYGNTAIGAGALGGVNTGDFNVALGNGAGTTLQDADKCVIIGYLADGAANADNQIAIGNGITTTAADEINIGGNIIGLMTASDRHTKFEGQVYTETHTLTDGATITPDFKDGNVQTVTLAGNRTLANPTNPKDGGTYIVIVKQDGTGSRTLAYGTNYKWEGGTAPTLSTGANAVDILTFVSDGTNMYGTKAQNFS